MELYVTGDGIPDPVLDKELDFNYVLEWWGYWQIHDWFKRESDQDAQPTMPANTKSLATQTEVQLSDMTNLDHRNSYPNEVLEFYVRRSGSAFEEDLLIAYNNMQGYCSECTHCKSLLRMKKWGNWHKWKVPNCRCGHPHADRRFYPFT